MVLKVHDTFDRKGRQRFAGAVHDEIFLSEYSVPHGYLVQHHVDPIFQLSDQNYFFRCEQSVNVEAVLLESVEERRVHLRQLFFINIDEAVKGGMHKTLRVVVGSDADPAKVAVTDPVE